MLVKAQNLFQAKSVPTKRAPDGATPQNSQRDLRIFVQ